LPNHEGLSYFVPNPALSEALLEEAVADPIPLPEERKKSSFYYWSRVIAPIKKRYTLTLTTGLVAVFPGMCLLLLITYAVSQLQGQPRLVTWPELLGEHASRWLTPIVRGTTLESGLSVEYQRWFVAPVLLIVALLANFLRGLQEFELEKLGETVARDLRNQLASRYLGSSFEISRRTQGSLIASFLGDDSREIRQCFTRLCGSIPTEIFNSCIYLILLLLLDTQLFVLFFVIFIPAGLIVRTTGSTLRKLARTGINVQTELSQSFLEKMKGWQTIQSLSSKPLELLKFEEKNSTIFHIWRRSARAKALSSPTVEWLGITAGAFVLVLALRRVSEGALPSTILTAFLVTVAQLSGSLQTAVNQFNSTKKGSAALKRLLDFLDDPQCISQEVEKKDSQTRVNSSGKLEHLRVRGLRIARPGQAGFNLVSDLNIDLSAGDKLAIVGPSGSGKSTLLECIAGLRQADEGTILLEAGEGATIANPVLAEHLSVSYLTQDPFYFPGTVGENVCYPDSLRPSDETQIQRIETALQRACLSNKNRFDSVLSLSGGEKQRLAFARAFFADPTVWLIDEGTSALDVATESQVLAHLDLHTAHSVKIFVAHRSGMQSFATQTILVGQDSLGRA